MKCESCNYNEMVCVDDARLENGSGFDNYMCPVCLSECYIEFLVYKIVTKKWKFRYEYLIRDESLVGKTYHDFQTVKNGAQK